MERRNATPLWRASLGLLITVVAAALLAFAMWRALSLNGQAGNSLPELARERTAIVYERTLFDLLVNLERYRLRLQLQRTPPDVLTTRDEADRRMRVAANFTAAHGALFQVTKDWGGIERLWAKARGLQRVYRGDDLSRLTKAVYDLIYKIEDTSGLEYESNRYSQDFADLLFAKIPQNVYDATYADLIAENAQTQGRLSIPDRVTLSGHLRQLRTDVDFSSDDWDQILAWIPNRLATPREAALYRRHGATVFTTGNALADAATNDVLMRERPTGSAAAMRAGTYAAVLAFRDANADVSALLDRQLAQRTDAAILRDRYVYVIVVFAALLLFGVMLLVADLTARRDREALSKAQQESARLSAELARQKAERALRLSEAQFRAVFDGAALGIAILDRSGAILDANAVFRNVYGDTSQAMLEGREEQFAELMRGERDLFEFEHHVMTPAGQEAWADATVSLVSDDAGNPYFAICMFRDLTELKRSERRMLHDMTHDALTGLPNRALFEGRIREQFAAGKSAAGSSFAVLVVDLDRFKDINESLGHESGDFVLSQVGHRIRAAVEAGDVVSRLGSDEFAILVRSLPDVLHVELVARRVLSALAKPVLLGARSIFVSASVGIAIASGNYERGEDVMRDADIAMHYAKGLGGRFAVFDSNMHARAEKRLQLTTDLRLALEQHQFDVLYQPIVNLATGELVGAEALLRWNHPTEGIMYPGEFIPLAEQTGLAAPIGRFVLASVCAQMMRWKRSSGRTLFPLNVNVSAAELLDPEFESVALRAVRECGVDTREVTLEITESVVLDAGTRPNALVERLRAAGFKICIDDFGTGYSSLRYLQQFKVDAIKIDRSFVSGHDGDVASEPIVRTLMTLAEAFGVRVVAEGVETERQRDVLRRAGCRFAQGYYYARPLTAEQFAAMYPAVFGVAAKHASA